MCGGKGCGKTSFIEQLVYGLPPAAKPFPTIEDIYNCYIETEKGQKERVSCTLHHVFAYSLNLVFKVA